MKHWTKVLGIIMAVIAPLVMVLFVCGTLGKILDNEQPVNVMAAETIYSQPVILLEPETTAASETPATESSVQTAAPTEETMPEETVVPTEIPTEETFPLETEPEVISPVSYDEVPLYYQTDYGHIRFNTGTMADSGCSVTCLAMVASYLTGHEYLPDQITAYFADYIGNNMELLEYASDQLQLPWEKAANFHVALQALREGKVVIALMNKRSLFTEGQHFIVLTGLNEDGKILVNDPNADNYTVPMLKNGFAEGFREGQIVAGFSGAWVYDPAAMPEEPFVYEPEVVDVELRYPGVELTSEEEYMLACLIWMEAQGEPFEGQQAIAEVVLNRLVADNFPNTVYKVLTAHGQFKSMDRLSEAKPVHTQYEAIRRALYGPYILPKDVVFFATYPVNKNVWGDIGGHTFCYQW